MSTPERKNILTVGVGRELFEETASPLLRKGFDVDRFPDPVAALELVSVVPFAALIIRHPLVGMTTDSFLAVVRRPGSASSQSRVALLVDDKDFRSAQELLERGVQLVVRAAAPLPERDQQMCTLLGISPRQDTRIMVKLNVVLAGEKYDRFIAQTKDISASGMFVITRKRHAVGSPASFEFTVADERSTIRGVAEVTRHSEPGARISGMGFRFVSFEGDSLERLRELVRRSKEQ